MKIVAGVLQIVLPFGVGRLYSGRTGLGIAQLLVTLVTFGFGSIWSFIDGILILVNGSDDGRGLPLRD
ncbi:MAG: NINE protein [Pseudonocardiaceae bacterium]|nr:NINE protein [Pseudonocardiaceae bacterium]